ncbi:PREDICTED: cytochrome P450 4C1-like, partial [Wasmannia auropunctata]|uniref:cytochrome P450 4C1-like n=1 Tax=Wasmannia auropunctata TaxID=64793 RepID=UPI0005EE8CB0
MQENQGKLTMKLLQNLPYLERCIKESLRLYPSIYFVTRTTLEDVKLKSYLLPAGTNIVLYIYGVHRDPNLWPNPEIFDPDFCLRRSKIVILTRIYHLTLDHVLAL